MAHLFKKEVELFKTDIKYSNYLPEFVNNLKVQNEPNPLPVMLALCKMLFHVQSQKLYLTKTFIGEGFDFAKWILTQYKNAMDVIFYTLDCNINCFGKMVPFLLKLYKGERKMVFRKKLNQIDYQDSFKRIVELGMNMERIEFKQNFLIPLKPFLSYVDIRLLILKLIPKIIKADHKHKSHNGYFNIYNLLICLTTCTRDMNLKVMVKNNGMQLLTPLYFKSKKNLTHQNNENDEFNVSDITQIDNNSNKVPKKLQILSAYCYQEAFTSAWVAFLTLYQLPQNVYTKVLSMMDTQILPNISKPMKFADFLINSYNMGGIISIMSLNGLFYLIQNQGLEYNDFYPRLYKLITRQIIDEQPQLRSKFCQQIDLFLSSTHLPAYLVASFIKRLARISLTSTPTGALVCLVLVRNLLIRHPSCQTLLNTKLLHQDILPITDQHNDDPFDNEEEDDLMKTKAMESHLWEIYTLQHHYSNSVSGLATKITLKKLVNSTEIPMSLYLDKTELQIYTESNQ